MRRSFFRRSNFILAISKRQKFIVTVLVSSLMLFFAESIFGKSGILLAFLLSISTSLLFLWSEYDDLKGNFSLQVFILLFFYSLSFALFYFLVPARFLTRITMTSLYGIGLYSLLLAQNIFVVSSIRTIALLSSARTVAFSMTILTYFFLSNVVFSLHFNIFITLLIFFVFSFPLILESLWTYTLESKLLAYSYWEFPLAICLVETALVLWFWPVMPTIAALFMTGLFYMMIGISQVWFEKRLFKSVMWEYVWVGGLIFLIFLFFAIRG